MSIDEDLKDIYRALAAGRITDEAAQAAEQTLQARRSRQHGNMGTPKPKKPAGHPGAAKAKRRVDWIAHVNKFLDRLAGVAGKGVGWLTVALLASWLLLHSGPPPAHRVAIYDAQENPSSRLDLDALGIGQRSIVG